MKQYREKSEEIAEHEKKQQEQIERYALINDITLSIGSFLEAFFICFLR